MGFLPFPAPLIVALRLFLSYQLRARPWTDGSELWDGRYILFRAVRFLTAVGGNGMGYLSWLSRGRAHGRVAVVVRLQLMYAVMREDMSGTAPFVD